MATAIQGGAGCERKLAQKFGNLDQAIDNFKPPESDPAFTSLQCAARPQ